MLATRSRPKELQYFLDKKPSHINDKKTKKLALNSGIQTYQILTNDDEVCIPSLSSILLAVCTYYYIIALGFLIEVVGNWLSLFICIF